jgi:putative membrane protein
MYCAKIRKEFEINCNTKSEKYFRYINEIPTILFILIVIIAVFKAEI